MVVFLVSEYGRFLIFNKYIFFWIIINIVFVNFYDVLVNDGYENGKSDI